MKPGRYVDRLLPSQVPPLKVGLLFPSIANGKRSSVTLPRVGLDEPDERSDIEQSWNVELETATVPVV